MRSVLAGIYRNPFFPLMLGALYLISIGVDVYLVDYSSKASIEHILTKWIPWGLKINGFLLLVATLFCWRDLWGMAKRFRNRTGILLLILFLATLLSTAVVAPRTHRIFYDEDIYGNVGQNMARKGITGYCNYGTFEYGEYYPHWVSYNKEPSGWPYLISLMFQLLGTDEHHAFTLNNVLMAAGVWIVFFIAWQVTGTVFSSFLTALLYALIPHNLTWGNTMAAEPGAAFFAGLTVLALVVFLKTRQTRHLFFLALVLPLACQMRPESGLIAFWVFWTLLWMAPALLREKRLWTVGLLPLLFLLPHFLHFYVVSGHAWGAEGSRFSVQFLGPNLKTNGLYYLNNRCFPVLTTGLAIMGVVFSGRLLKWRLLFVGWFLLFWGIFLFFYAGSYEYGADVRFALLSFMPLALLAGLGGGWLRDWIMDRIRRIRQWSEGKIKPLQTRSIETLVSLSLVSLTVVSFLDFLPLVRQVGQEAWGSRYDHQYARQFIERIPRRSIVLTQNPTMLLLWGQNAIQTYAGINNPGLIRHLLKKYQGHVYFHHNYWCNTQNQRNVKLCQGIRDKYHLEEVARATEQDYTYGLYRLSFVE